jgi:hypothetical protein
LNLQNESGFPRLVVTPAAKGQGKILFQEDTKQNIYEEPVASHIRVGEYMILARPAIML